MSQFIDAWNSLPMRRRVIVGLATAAVFLAVLGLTRLSGGSNMALLYSGLDATASGEVIGALDGQGVSYEVRGSAIYVDASQRDALRMSLAAEGLPASNGEGYELLDGLSGFGTTSQMFDAAYWRAKEGELARTILASPGIRAARVHISALSGRPFERGFTPSASVAVTTTGGALDAANGRAIRYLVSAAVAGLTPEAVAVIDSRTGAVLDAGDELGTDPSGRAEELRKNVLRLLEARVGIGHAIVEVAVELGRETESIVSRQIDPASRVQIRTETEEKSGSSSGTTPPNVTVASNLPAGQAAQGGQSKSQDNTTREQVNYDVSETKRELLRKPGAVRRITVAVLVDGIRSTDAQGNQTWTARPQAELDALRDLVASAVGYDQSRNDTITVKSLEFTPPDTNGTLATGPAAAPLLFDVTTLAQIAALALVALVLGLFVLRPALKGGSATPVPAGLPAPDPSAEVAAATGSAATGQSGVPALTGTIDDGQEPEFSPDFAPAMAMAGGLDGFPDGGSDDPVARLRQLIADRREETVEILRAWMEEREGSA